MIALVKDESQRSRMREITQLAAQAAGRKVSLEELAADVASAQREYRATRAPRRRPTTP
jgi:hypothetical protein